MRTLPERIARQIPFARRSLDIGGVKLSVVDEGNGPTILFIHGNPTWSYLWRGLMGPALKEGFRVVAPDHAGFGLSEKPKDPAYYSLERHVANLCSMVRALDLHDITLVLHDWGGPIGMGLAVEEPDRIKRIVVCNTVAFPPKETRPLTKWHKWLSTWWGYQLGVQFNVVETSAMKLGVVKPLSPGVRAAYDWPMRERGARVAAARFVQMVPDGPDHESAVVLRRYQAEYPKLAKKPMLVLWADKDRVMRARFAQRWLDDFPDAVVKHVAPEAGHYWQEDAPELFLPHILSFARP
jgi:haloalkane dehalogenase